MVVVFGDAQPVEAVAVRPRAGRPRSSRHDRQIVEFASLFVNVAGSVEQIILRCLRPISMTESVRILRQALERL